MKKILFTSFLFVVISDAGLAAGNCPESLAYMRSNLTSEIKDDPSLDEPLINSIKTAGGASALIAIYEGQKQAYTESKNSALESAKATSSGTNPIGKGLCPSGEESMTCEAIHGYYLADDGVKLSDATIKAAKCYQQQGY